MKIRQLDKLPNYETNTKGRPRSELSKRILALPIGKIIELSGFNSADEVERKRISILSMSYMLRKQGEKISTRIDKKGLKLYITKLKINVIKSN